MGVSRVVLGTTAVKDKRFLESCLSRFQQQVIVSIDAKKGMVTTEGWQRSGGVRAAELARALKDLGVRELIYTDIAKDGTLSGPNFEALRSLIAETGLQLVASGGVSSLQDLKLLAGINGVIGAIVGKALYEEKFTLKEALRAVLPGNRHTDTAEGISA
jgi:phosphoribosylformimino-5-aminoimidazole carboxamide ribotide isomerase